MIVKNNSLVKQCSKSTVIVMLTISSVSLTIQETSAKPLELILDRAVQSVVPEIFSVDADTEVPPAASQTSTNTQEETDLPPETPQETGSPPGNPTYPPQAYPPSYAPYPSQVYPPSYAPYPPQIYPPTYPQTYPLPVYVLPNSVAPAYPSSAPSSGQSGVPLIINNVIR